MHVQQIERAAMLMAVLGLASHSALAAPTAADDSYSVSVNGVLVVAAGSGLLVNDTGFDPATHRLENADTFGQYGGRVEVNADGSFRYDPPPGFRGLDSFGYTVRSSDGASSAVVRIDVGGEVAPVVNGSAAPAGNGTVSAPFNSFGPVRGSSGEGNVDAAERPLFVCEGTCTRVEFKLEARQRLIGHGVGLDLAGTRNVIAASTAPALCSASSFPIVEVFGQGGAIRGLHVQNTAGWANRSAAVANGGFAIVDVLIAASGIASGGIDFLNSTGTLGLTNAGSQATRQPLALQFASVSIAGAAA